MNQLIYDLAIKDNNSIYQEGNAGVERIELEKGMLRGLPEDVFVIYYKGFIEFIPFSCVSEWRIIR